VRLVETQFFLNRNPRRLARKAPVLVANLPQTRSLIVHARSQPCAIYTIDAVDKPVAWRLATYQFLES
jgi:hypothetical protein